MNTPPLTPDQQQSQTSPLAISAQYVKDFSFENPNAPQSLAEMTNGPQISVNMNVDGRQLAERQFEVILKIQAEAKKGDASIFIIELSYAGVCQVAVEVSQEKLTPLVMIEGPRMLFPFARGIVATATRDGGFPPLLLNPVNFVAMYQQFAVQQATGRQNNGTSE